MSDLVGQSIDRYHIIEQLGEGGMATVYKAYDTRLERDVAVKVMRLVGSEDIERFLKRFEREARTLAKLKHPNVVNISDYGEYRDMPYLVMDYLPGGTLAKMMGKPMPYQQAAKILSPISDALAYAHEQGLLHRDIKPSNILLTESGQPMLADFGIAKILGVEVTTELTGTGVGIGTPNYMAPEQWMGKPEAKTDLYALGIVFYELVTGRLPYIAETPAAVLLKHINDPLPRPKQFNKQLPESVEKVIFKALAKRPQDRFHNLSAFTTVLERLSHGLVVSVGKLPSVQGKSTSRMIPWVIAGLGVFGVLAIVALSAALLVSTGIIDLNKPLPEAAAIPKSTDVSNQNLVDKSPTGSTQAEHSNEDPVVSTPTPTLTVPPTETALPTPTRLEMGSTIVSSIDSMILVYVPEGEFIMGADSNDPEAQDHEWPQHRVYLDAFWIDMTEVTNAMFAQFVKETGYLTEAEETRKGWIVNLSTDKWQQVNGADWRHPRGAGSTTDGIEDHPVVQISWKDAQSFCEWAERRLPSEAEWEKAARSDDSRRYPWGNQTPSGSLANLTDRSLSVSWADTSINDGYAYTSPVGNYPAGASPYGAFDMAGNVWEWVADWYAEDYYYNSPSSNPSGPGFSDTRVLKGGSWHGFNNYLRSSSRGAHLPYFTYDSHGFRCAMTSQ